MLHQYHRKPVVYIHGTDGPINISRFVITATTQRAIGQPVSSCTVTLVNAPGANPNGNSNLFLSAAEWISLIKKIIRPQQVVSIQMFPEDGIDEQGNETFVEETFIGLIDIIHQNENYEGGQPSISYQFSAAGLLGKILTKEAIVGSQVLAVLNNPELTQILGQKWSDFFRGVRGLTETGTNVFIGNPDPSTAIKFILRNAVRFRKFLAIKPDGSGQLVDFDAGTSNEESIKQILDMKALKYEYLFGPELSVYTGTIWNYILRTLDTRFYETYIDTTPFKKEGASTYQTREKLVIRPIPFSYRFMEKVYEKDEIDRRLDEGWIYWEELQVTGEFNRSDVLSTDLSCSDSQHFNWFTMQYNNTMLAPPGSGISVFGYSSPLINPQGIMEFGLREMNYETKNPFNFKELQDSINKAKADDKPAQFSKEGESVLTLNLQSKKNRVMEWHSFPYYEYGQVTVNGNRNIRIGTKIRLLQQEYCYTLKNAGGSIETYSGIGMEYYVTLVEHSYTVGRDTRTRITVQKGIPIITDNTGNHPVKIFLENAYKNRIDVGKELLLIQQKEDDRLKKIAKQREIAKKLVEAGVLAKKKANSLKATKGKKK